MEVGRQGSSYVIVQPDPNHAPDGYLVCQGEDDQEYRAPSLKKLQESFPEAKSRYKGELFVLVQSDRVVRKL